MSISAEEKKFIVYWEQNRDKDKKLSNQLMFGLPIVILFSFPVNLIPDIFCFPNILFSPLHFLQNVKPIFPLPWQKLQASPL